MLPPFDDFARIEVLKVLNPHFLLPPYGHPDSESNRTKGCPVQIELELSVPEQSVDLLGDTPAPVSGVRLTVFWQIRMIAVAAPRTDGLESLLEADRNCFVVSCCSGLC